MFVRKAYSSLPFSWRMRFDLTMLSKIAASVIFLLSATIAFGQEEYDEIPVFLEVPNVGGGEINSVIRGTELFLPVTDLFDFLKIRNVPEPDLESVSGFFINPEATYIISRKENIIRYQDKTFNLEPGELIRTESNLYLRSSYFGKVFGLECNFNFRNLSVTVNSKLELPLIREMRQEEMRKNLNHIKGEVKADTVIGRSYPMFKFGMADWSAIATEEVKGKTDVRLGLALGAMIAGGEATANLYYDNQQPFSEKQQNYLWRYVNNDFSAVRQVMAGKISTHSISSIYNPVIGVQITNTPTTYRRSFGSYTLSDRTEPGWIVELYVNNVLVDYIKADASGFFTFQVPLVYGNSMVKLKFFGPWGEERVREQNINIPFNFLPVNTLEYTASAGIVEDSVGSRFSRANVNYGVARSLTVGGGVEYLSSVTSGPAMPFVNTSVRITNNILLSGEYTYGVRAKGTFSYRLPSNLQLDLNYTWYEKDQKAIYYNYREERKAVLSMPLRLGKFYSYQRFSVYQIVLPASNYTTGEWLFSGSILGVNTNLTTYALFIDANKPNIYSNLSLSVRFPGGFIIMPQAQFGYTQKEVISAKIGLEKHLLDHAYLNMSYEQMFSSNIRLAELGFRYDFSFAQTGVSVRQSDKTTSFVQYARGSIINDSKTRYIGTDNRTNVGKGAISITAFIDLNNNGHRDSGEPGAYGLNLRANGGRIEKSDRDSTIRILGLEPYTSCFIELDPNSFENVSWRMPNKTFSVAVDPEIMKNIEIPITVAGEATGKVSLEKDGSISGQGRIIISFYTSALKPAGKTITESDGYFSYFGLSPGKYIALIDTAQLRRLNMSSDPESRQFNLASGIDGDIAEGLDFTLRMKSDTTTKQVVPVKPVVKKDTTYMVVHEVTQELVTITEDSYAIQLGAFQVRANAEVLRRKLEKLVGRNAKIIVEDNFFKVRISEITERAEVDRNLEILKKNGITEVWVISLKAKKQQLVLTEKQDTIRQITETLTNPDLIGSQGITVQLGAFRDKSNALELMKQLKARYGDRLRIVFEDGFYKLRLSGMTGVKRDVLDELNKLGPNLGKIKFKDIWMSPPVAASEEKPVLPAIEEPVSPVKEEPVVTKRLVITVERAEKTIEIPGFIQPGPNPEIITRLIPSKIARPTVQPALTISIQVGVFDKKSDALKAQRKITSKLKLQVEIVEKWNRYIVLIRGFHTREETYPYYPELAGLGYPGVSLIEE
jgi:hypothetical protein